MADTVTYWSLLDQAILQTVADKAVIESAMVQDILADDDWYGAIYTLEIQQRQLEYLRYAHRLARMSDDEAEALLLNSQSGALRQSRSYVVTINDTPEKIQAKFGISIETILDFNDISVDDLYPGYNLQIPIITASVTQVSDSIPTYDTHTGKNILGKDLANPIYVDANGDLATVDPIGCFEQGLSNIITTKMGAHPLLPNFGWDNTVPQEIGEEIEIQWRALKLAEALRQDTRVQSVVNVKANIDGDAVTLSADVVAVNGIQVTLNRVNEAPIQPVVATPHSALHQTIHMIRS